MLRQNSNTFHKPSSAEVKIALSERMEPLCRALISDKPKRCGNELRYGSNVSLAVCIAGDKSGVWHDHEADAGGTPDDGRGDEARARASAERDWDQVQQARDAVQPQADGRRARPYG